MPDEHDPHGNSEDEWETASDESSDEGPHDHDDRVIDTSIDARGRQNGEESTTNRENQDQNTEKENPVDYNAINVMLSNQNPGNMSEERYDWLVKTGS